MIVKNNEIRAEKRDKVINKQGVILATQQWVDEFVIAMNLCPFAKKERQTNGIKFEVSEAQNELQLLEDLQSQLALLQGDLTIETCLLIHPEALLDFEDYNQFLSLADELLAVMKLDGVIQIASFHPCYQFEGTEIDAAENYTNRSPFPMLHLLREASVSRAVNSYPNSNEISEKNIAHLQSCTKEILATKLKKIKLIGEI